MNPNDDALSAMTMHACLAAQTLTAPQIDIRNNTLPGKRTRDHAPNELVPGNAIEVIISSSQFQISAANSRGLDGNQ
jgi:hypothetical protein